MKTHNAYLLINSKIKYFVFLCFYFFLFPFAKILYGRQNNWIICERGTDAQDNAFVFFCYLVKNHPEIRCYYLIDKKSSDYSKVSSIGRVVQFGSFKHLLLTIGCPVKISSHLYGYSPWVALTKYYRRNKTIDKHVFLQHGITKNYHLGLSKESCNSLDLFVCGAKPEFDYILNEFHYNNSVPQYTGFPRYDLLFDYSVKNQIIIMPTWRSYLVNLSDKKFENTNYFKSWKTFISSNYLKEIAKNNGLTIKFYMHHSFQKFLRLFGEYDFVNIVDYKDETVQSLLKDSKLLITDYSSVYFDFAYMNKPLVYFQFDEDEYYSGHYEKGYFDYRRDGFGDVCTNYDEIINSISRIINSGFSLDQKYKKRIDRFFVYKDTNNSKRVYDAIMRTLNEKR